MSLLDTLHEQYESDGDLVLFRCRECGYTTLSLGGLHGHIEGHESIVGQLRRLLPLVGPDYVDPLMDRTDVLVVSDVERVDLEEVEGL